MELLDSGSRDDMAQKKRRKNLGGQPVNDGKIKGSSSLRWGARVAERIVLLCGENGRGHDPLLFPQNIPRPPALTQTEKALYTINPLYDSFRSTTRPKKKPLKRHKQTVLNKLQVYNRQHVNVTYYNLKENLD
jgi:hypothetical protein